MALQFRSWLFTTYFCFLIIKMKITVATFQDMGGGAGDISVLQVKPRNALFLPQPVKSPLVTSLSEERPPFQLFNETN